MRRFLLLIFQLWERIYALVCNLESVDGNNDIILFSKKKYNGADLKLTSGEIIKKGDVLLELHLNNRVIYDIYNKSDTLIKAMIKLKNEFESNLKKLANLMRNSKNFDNVRGLMGITYFYKIAGMMGFDIIDIRVPIINIGQKLLLYLYNKEAFRNMLNKGFESRMVIISKEKLLNMCDK